MWRNFCLFFKTHSRQSFEQHLNPRKISTKTPLKRLVGFWDISFTFSDHMCWRDGVIYSTLLQKRMKAIVYLDGGFFLNSPPPGGDQADFAPRMKKPVLMVNGRYDFSFSLEKAQDPFFAMLGTPNQDKRHLVLDTPHDVTAQRSQLIKAVLDWLDLYLGRVNE